MKRWQTLTGLTAGMVLSASGAMAQPVLDMKGTWAFTSWQAIVDGPAPPGSRAAGPYWVRTGQDAALRIEGQDGRTFWGTIMIGEKVRERVIGSLSHDGKRLIAVDADGHFEGTVIDADTIDHCYSHIAPQQSVVSCTLLKRQK
jgi:hypothetical protein